MLIDLKIAILRSGKTQRTIAQETCIPEVRLSAIVRGAASPRNDECAALENILGLGKGSIASSAIEARSAR